MVRSVTQQGYFWTIFCWLASAQLGYMPKLLAELAMRQHHLWLGIARTPLKQGSQRKQMKVCLLNITFCFPFLMTSPFHLNDLLATADQAALRHLPTHRKASLGQGC